MLASQVRNESSKSLPSHFHSLQIHFLLGSMPGGGLLVVILLLSLSSFPVTSFRVGGVKILRTVSLFERLNKSPGLEVPADQLRGTTVPTTSKTVSHNSGHTNKRLINIAGVDPADPFTFGYVHVGKVVSAHGVHGEVKIQINPDFIDLKVKAGLQMFIKKPTRRSPRPVSVVRSRRQGSSDSDIHLVLFEQVHTRTVASLFTKYEVYVKEHNARANMGTDEYMVRDMVDLDCFHLRDFDAVMKQLDDTEGTLGNSSASILPPVEKILPIARIVGVVTADELCDGPVAVSLMHDQLELQVFPATKPPNRAARRKMHLAGAGAKEQSGAAQPSQRLQPQAAHKSMRCCLLPLVPSIVPVVDLVRRVVFLDPPPGLLDLTYEVREKEKPLRGFLPARIERLTDRERQIMNSCTKVSIY